MEELIKKILQIENDAQEIVRSARNAQDNFSADMDARLGKLRSDINTEAQRKIAQMEAYEKGEIEDTLNAIQRDTDQKLQDLDKQYNENADMWTDRIFANVINTQ